MKHFRMISHLRLLAFALLAACYGSMQAQDDLLEYINSISKEQTQSRRAGNDITVIDLSKFNAVNREVTLPIKNGLRVRFINGTLTRAASLDGPILELEAGSYVEVAEGATITTEQSVSNRETILMEGAELRLEDAAIRGKKAYTSVLMTSANDHFTMDGGTLFATLVCEQRDAKIIFNGGNLEWNEKDGNSFIYYDHFRTACDITVNAMPINDVIWAELTGKSNIITLNSDFSPLFYIKAPAKAGGDVLVKALRLGSYWDLDDVKNYTRWQGDSKYALTTDKQANTVKLYYDDLWEFIYDHYPYTPDPGQPCGCVWEYPIPMDVPCEGSKVKKDLEFPDDDLYWALYGRPENQEEEYDCEGGIEEGENDVTIKPKAKVRWRWLRWRGCGCQGKHIWVWGTLRIYRVWYYYYWRFIHVMPGGKVEIEDLNGDCDETVVHVEGGEVDYDGDHSHCTGGKYGWYCPGGTFRMRGGWLSGGTCGGWTGPSGKSYHYGGTVHGGIHNYGWHYWHGGYCTGGGDYVIYNHKGGHFYYHGGTCGDGGKGMIWNEGDLYIDGGGSVSCGDIYCVRGGCVYILKRLTFTLRLVFTAENIVSGATVVVGGDGYKLSQEDLGKLQIVLPDGYEWRYDSSCGCISIINTSGIESVSADQAGVRESYEMSGRKAADGSKGLSIQRLTDGTVRKVTTK